MKQLIANLKQVEVITWPATVLVTTFQVALGPTYTSISSGTQVQNEQNVFLATEVVYWTLAILAKTTFLKNKRIVDAPAASITTLIALALIASLGSRVFSVLWFHQPMQTLSPVRLLTIALSVFIWNLLIALWVGQSKQHKNEIQNLQAAIQQTEALERQAKPVLEQAQARTIAKIEETINAAWVKLNPGGRVSMQLIDLVNDVVRPLSREIAATEIGVISQKFDQLTKISIRQRWERWKLLLTNLSLYDPVFTPIVVVVLPYFTRTFVAKPLGAERSLVIAYLMFISVMYAGRKLEKKFGKNLTLENRITVALVVFVVTASADAVIFSSLFSRIGATSIPMIASAELLICAMVMMIRLIFADRRQIVLELQRLKERLSWLTARSSQLIWVEQQRLSNLVHGHMQAQIVSAAFKFEENETDSKAAKKLLANLHSELSQILTHHNRTEPVPTFIESLKILWSQSIQIDSNMETGVAEILANDQDASDAIIEVIREALTNAAKHSKAKNVTIQFALQSGASTDDLANGYIKLCITNDGAPLSQGSKAGAGSAFFSAVSLKWNLETVNDHVEFSALIPFSK